MNTRYFTIQTPDDAAQIEAAAEILRRGGLLAIPTETVYGLGADGLNEKAVAGIFEAKGRPQDNPLILHIPSADWLTRYCKDVPETAYRLAARFWPGPLTMILKKREFVPLRTTGGLDTVGMRCPDHAVTRAIIEAAGVPVAAPSANTSGRPSCTTAAHVRADMDGKINGVVDGGDCAVGVESTIIDLTCDPPRLLRPGGLPLEELRAVLGEVALDKAVTGQLSADEKPRAPGMKYRHYAPKAPVTVVTGTAAESGRWLRANAPEDAGLILFDEFAPLFPSQTVRTIGAAADKREQARRVFDALRFFDDTDVSEIYAQCPDASGLGLAVGNRLKKAAGFKTVDARDGALVLGFTGGTGAGKTTLLRAFEGMGAVIVDCDAFYYERLRCDERLRADLNAAFPGVVSPDGELDRRKLGELVFGNAERLAELDRIVFAHLPRAVVRRIAESGAALAGIDAVKLTESGLGALCDATVAVVAPEAARAKRIMARDGISEARALERIRAQKSGEAFAAACTHVFENNAESVEEAQIKAEQFISRLVKEIKEDKQHGG
ncbi:MAG: threonylcarbamoyl-AMP synthase [Ruminococcaceae bacterium]|nr:threonylcarbamoyl-AMP synthase [Oscillospiraceae bacterium]